MKKKIAIFAAFCSMSILLSSCGFLKNLFSPNNNEETDTGGTASSDSGDSSLNEKSFSIYTLNDFHGAVEEITDKRMGLLKMGSFFKKKGEEENTIILDQGDTWQGSIYSNSNYGAMINDVMCYAKFDARTVGNHDFDWGIQPVVDNTARSYDGYSIPTLAANIYEYDFDTKEFGPNQRSDIGQSTTTITLENGMKIGVVGLLGFNQIESITTTYVRNIGFKPHIPVIKEEATRLRNEGCDFVICSYHGDQDELINNKLSDYIDLALCAHTHQRECTVEDGLVYLQAGRNGEAYGEIHVTYSNNRKNIEYWVRGYEGYYNLFDDVDPQIQTIIDGYKDEALIAQANEVVVQSASGNFKNGSNYHDDSPLVDLMTRAIYDQCVLEGYDDIILAYSNFARTSINKNQWTYADIYDAFPFDNRVYIIEATGKEIKDQVGTYYWVCKKEGFNNKFEYLGKYKIAVLDYVMLHCDSAHRQYDWFPQNNANYIGALQDNYRVILKNWLARNHYSDGQNTLVASDFSNCVERYSKSSFTFTIPERYIQFNLNGGSVIEGTKLYAWQSVDMIFDSIYPYPNPYRDGYRFSGWYLDQACTQCADGLYIDVDRTLYAGWTPINIPNSTTVRLFRTSLTSYPTGSHDISTSFGNLNVYYDNLTDASSYNEIQFNSNSQLIFTAPENYEILQAHIEVRYQYDNFTLVNENGTISSYTFNEGYNLSTYEIEPNSRLLYLNNYSVYKVYVYYIELIIGANQ